MSDTKNTGGCAFPIEFHYDGPTMGSKTTELHTGMTLRDYFAAKAMQGICASVKYPDEIVIPGFEACDDGIIVPSVARHAYAMADAMLKAREQ